MNCPHCNSPLPEETAAAGGLCPACLLKRGLEPNTLPPTLPAAPWMPPTLDELAPFFPDLDLLSLLGRGGMGAVYKARQKSLDRLIALKILPPQLAADASFPQRFTHEAQALARLNHPHIVTIYDFGTREFPVSSVQFQEPVASTLETRHLKLETLFFLSMEYIDGLSLRQLLAASRLAPETALAIVPQICDALQYAHDRGIVHRDIKPENILLTQSGQIKIADFGLAKIMSPSSPSDHWPPTTDHSTPAGTPQYMAPEQSSAPATVDHRADIYALGVVFYQMLTGELPTGKFDAPSKKVHIDIRLDEIVLRALEQNPEARYQNATQFKTEVETVMTTASPLKPAAFPLSPARPLYFTLALHAFLLLAVMVFWRLIIPTMRDQFKAVHVVLPAPVQWIADLCEIHAPYLALLLLLDLAACLLLHRVFGRLALRLWTAAVIAVVALLIGISIVSLSLPDSVAHGSATQDAALWEQRTTPGHPEDAQTHRDCMQLIPGRWEAAKVEGPGAATFSPTYAVIFQADGTCILTSQSSNQTFQWKLIGTLVACDNPTTNYGADFLLVDNQLILRTTNDLGNQVVFVTFKKSADNITLSSHPVTVARVQHGDMPHYTILPATVGQPSTTQPASSTIPIRIDIPQSLATPLVQNFRNHRLIPVTIQTPDSSTQLAHGTLTCIAPEFDEKTNALPCTASVTPEPNTVLLPNQYVNARLLLENAHNATFIPAAALRFTHDAACVFLINPDHTVTERPVVAGREFGEKIEILTGLSPGDLIVVDGGEHLHTGDKVRYAPPPEIPTATQPAP